MSTKHTPGPWMYDSVTKIGNPETGYPVFRVIDADNCLVVTTQESTVPGRDFRDCVDRVEANARLIAAAPDLLGMLKHIASAQRVFPETSFSPGFVSEIEELIAKAEGRKP